MPSNPDVRARLIQKLEAIYSNYDVDLKEVDFNFKENDLINIIGELRITTTGEKILDAQIIQDMKKLNFKYYKNLYELKKEILEN